MVPVVLQGRESVLEVERSGLLVQGIYFDRPNAHVIGDMGDSAKRIDQQVMAQPSALLALVYGKLAEQDDRHVDLRQTFRQVGGESLIADLVNSQRVVADNSRLSRSYGHIRPCQVTTFVLPRQPF